MTGTHIHPIIGDQELVIVARRIEALYVRIRRLEADLSSYPPGTKVFHPKFGRGVVEQIEGDKLTIRFDGGETKDIRDSSVCPAAIPMSELAGPCRSRLDVATDGTVEALRYVVWCIGETLMATVGLEGMHAVMGILEDGEHGTRIASWLDHRWDGVTVGHESWWA